tara:strand:- start:176 stop:832 length:657 start_codon:yes stop_codon:yes gene_type:complete
MHNPVLKLENIYKSYHQANKKLEILNDFNLTVEKGQFAAITGPSGSGKTTLLNIIGLIDNLDRGELYLNGEDIINLSSDKKNQIRRENFGFIYQNYNLLENFNAIENVSLPLILNGVKRDEAFNRAYNIMKIFSVDNRLSLFPNSLSGGEQQRIAISRALVNKPEIIIADEPTGNLDHVNSSKVFNYLVNYVESENMTLIMATHNIEWSKRADLNVEL